MPTLGITLGEACQSLRVSRRTLDKWLQRLGIEPTRHAWDYRFYEITADELEQIADARKKLPVAGSFAHMSDIRPTSSPLAFDRQQSEKQTMRDPRPARLTDALPLPDGMMARSEVAARHGIAETTLRRWCDAGRIETDGGSYGGEHGQFSIHKPVTRRGLAQFYALAHRRADFRPCESCPHGAESGELHTEIAEGVETKKPGYDV